MHKTSLIKLFHIILTELKDKLSQFYTKQAYILNNGSFIYIIKEKQLNNNVLNYFVFTVSHL